MPKVERIHLGTISFDIGVGSDKEHIRIEEELAAKEREEIEELVDEGHEHAVIEEKFSDSPVLGAIAVERLKNDAA